MDLNQTGSSEKRKEKSRDAARSRRGKESEIFSELAEQIPIPSSIRSQLDKASVMRLAIGFLRLNTILEGQHIKDNDRLREELGMERAKLNSLCSKALDGFVFIISKEGDIVFISEAVSRILGIQQIDIMGQNLLEFVHPCDHDDIQDLLSHKSFSLKPSQSENRSFFVRFKCTLTSRGRSVNLKSASYKVIKCTGKMVMPRLEGEKKIFEEKEEYAESNPYLIAVGEPIPHPSNIEIPLDCKTFLSRHSMDMKFTDCDERIQDLIGYDHEELIGQSLYSYQHALDSHIVEKAFKDLFSKGQTWTGQYRFLAKNGGYAWVMTQGTVICNSRMQKPQCVVCVHFVLSAVEQKNIIESQVQIRTMSRVQTPVMSPVSPSAPVTASPIKDNLLTPFIFQPLGFSTEDVFSRKTQDMEEEFYFPPGTKKPTKVDETVDLSHLAPTAGDACIPLPFSSIKKDSYGTDLNLIDNFMDLEKEEDIFSMRTLKKEPQQQMYRQECMGYSSSDSSRTVSPYDPIEQPSSNDFSVLLQNQDISIMDQIFSTLDTKVRDKLAEENPEEIDFSMRAPYIPMDAEDDFSLIPPTTDVLFEMNGDLNPGLFGRTESVFGPKDKLFEEAPKNSQQQSLQDMLGGSPIVATIKSPPDIFNLQIKHPLDMNSLEKGPPAPKVPRLVAAARPVLRDRTFIPTTTTSINSSSSSGGRYSSVLMNLLMKGEDPTNGYKVNNKHTPCQQGMTMFSPATLNIVPRHLSNTDCGMLLTRNKQF
ncbi:hypothetical protein CHS0354_039735 [Potamilus streckersoni]|uniref:Hypoxia-inducible factor 1-alpha n=1 Tax=Potamilus streckersoni TaxID=2493646 RepID=A0AAE0VF81_9BIVA|nr:hypothetical protein CHS0354_039735 [Potamilus streckersoni]